jgi:hypothetical protein
LPEPLLIIAGIPQGIYIRHKRYLPKVRGWQIALIPSRDHARANLSTCLDDILSMADRASSDGVHVVAAHYIDDEQPALTKWFYARHRVMWMDRSYLRVYGTPKFDDYIQAVSDFESEWRLSLRPLAVKDALMLPECAFVAASEVRELWRRSQVVSPSRDNIPAVTKLAEKFSAAHLRAATWIDEREKCFSYAGKRHADHVVDALTWKFTFKIPDGFHFDVKNQRDRAFNITNHAGDTFRFNKYTNCDCHGVLRGGD